MQDTDHVILLGTKGGPAIRPGSTMPTSNLFCLGGQQIVVDCGLGVTRGLVDQGIELRDLSLIFITHLHSDHYLELGPLLHTAWTAGLKTPVTVYGPPGLENYWDGFFTSMEDDIALRIEDEGRPDLARLVTIKTIDAGYVMSKERLEVSAIRTAHPPLIDCFALSFRTPDTHVVFSGDTAPIPEMIDFAKDADLLIHEAMLPAALPALCARVGNGSDKLMEHLLRSHSAADEVAKIAEEARVKRLALNHLVPSDDPDYGPSDWEAAVRPAYAGSFFLGQDGLKITLG
ncbi:MAG: MBL fold metallo-hydrolase [Pseudomonadota bacterium]